VSAAPGGHAAYFCCILCNFEEEIIRGATGLKQAIRQHWHLSVNLRLLQLFIIQLIDREETDRVQCEKWPSVEGGPHKSIAYIRT